MINWLTAERAICLKLHEVFVCMPEKKSPVHPNPIASKGWLENINRACPISKTPYEWVLIKALHTIISPMSLLEDDTSLLGIFCVELASCLGFF